MDEFEPTPGEYIDRSHVKTVLLAGGLITVLGYALVVINPSRELAQTAVFAIAFGLYIFTIASVFYKSPEVKFEGKVGLFILMGVSLFILVSSVFITPVPPKIPAVAIGLVMIISQAYAHSEDFSNSN